MQQIKIICRLSNLSINIRVVGGWVTLSTGGVGWGGSYRGGEDKSFEDKT